MTAPFFERFPSGLNAANLYSCHILPIDQCNRYCARRVDADGETQFVRWIGTPLGLSFMYSFQRKPKIVF